VRRRLTQEYLEAVDWSDISHINRVLRVFERLVHGYETQYSSRFLNSLRRDGYVVDEETTPIGPRFSLESLKNLTDASAIRQQPSRIQRAILDDPALAVGSAKELIESTAKVVLTERGRQLDEKAELPALARERKNPWGCIPRRAHRARTAASSKEDPRRRLQHLHRPGRASEPWLRHGARPCQRSRRAWRSARSSGRQRGLHLVSTHARHPRRPERPLAEAETVAGAAAGAESPSKVISKAFRAAFQRLLRRCRPRPVGSRLIVVRYRHFRAACSVGKWPRA